MNRGLQRRNLDDVKYIGIDEKSFLKGQSYAGILYDLSGSRVLEVEKDRTEESTKTLLGTIPEEVRSNIKAAAVDMWEPFLKAVNTVLPSTDVVHDKYHIASHLSKAVDDVRR